MEGTVIARRTSRGRSRRTSLQRDLSHSLASLTRLQLSIITCSSCSRAAFSYVEHELNSAHPLHSKRWYRTRRTPWWMPGLLSQSCQIAMGPSLSTYTSTSEVPSSSIHLSFIHGNLPFDFPASFSFNIVCLQIESHRTHLSLQQKLKHNLNIQSKSLISTS